jgi:hypothetical protein
MNTFILTPKNDNFCFQTGASDFSTGGLRDPIPLPYIRAPLLAVAFGGTSVARWTRMV